MNLSALAAGAAVTILLAACGSSSDETGSAPAPSSAVPSSAAAPSAASEGSQAPEGIVISDFKYSGTMTVKSGEKVTVTNQDSVAHTVTSGKAGLFDTGSVAGSGGTGTFTAPDKSGSYPFICTFHPNMAGTLVVEG